MIHFTTVWMFFYWFFYSITLLAALPCPRSFDPEKLRTAIGQGGTDQPCWYKVMFFRVKVMKPPQPGTVVLWSIGITSFKALVDHRLN
jgi:hypothetical protein